MCEILQQNDCGFLIKFVVLMKEMLLTSYENVQGFWRIESRQMGKSEEINDGQYISTSSFETSNLNCLESV